MRWRRGGTTLHRHRGAMAMRLKRHSLGAEAMSPGVGGLVLSRLPHGWRWADLLQQRAHAMVARLKAQPRIGVVARRPRGSRDGAWEPGRRPRVLVVVLPRWLHGWSWANLLQQRGHVMAGRRRNLASAARWHPTRKCSRLWRPSSVYLGQRGNSSPSARG
jgi:hypothetical protein